VDVGSGAHWRGNAQKVGRMTDKQFVKENYPSAISRITRGVYDSRYTCIIVAYPTTLMFGFSTASHSPKGAWKRAAEIIRKEVLKRFES
jgi:transposase